MEKRFYILLFCILTISVFLLGFSFSKDSGVAERIVNISKDNEEYRVIYSDNVIELDKESSFTVSIINKSDVSRKFYLSLLETDLNYDKVYYSINDGDKVELTKDYIFLGELSNYGTLGDQVTYDIKLFSEVDYKYSFDVLVSPNNGGNNVVNDKTIKTYIMKSDQVYTDKDGNTRYYGVNVNNYINYNGEKYQIIGVVNDKVKIISKTTGLGVYKEDANYANLKDYFGSFNNDAVTKDNVLQHKSWIISNGFWLEDTEGGKAYYASKNYGVGLSVKNVDYYLRYVYELDSDMVVSKGDGSINNPYEVTYGS